MDTEVLTIAAEQDDRRPYFTTVDDVAERLGIGEDEARQRLDRLVQSGHLVGPMLVGFQNDPLREIGYGCTWRGKEAVDG